MKWVHEDCLQRWIDEKQKGSNSPLVKCSQCKTCYVFSFPPINCLVRLMEQYDKLLYGSSPFVAGEFKDLHYLPQKLEKLYINIKRSS